MRIQDLDVVHVVVTIALLDVIEQAKAVLQLLVELHMMNGLLHLRDFNVELVLLVRDKLIEGITTLG